MCFSATASFTASVLLLICSIIAFKRAHKKQYMIAAIPLLFSIQQFLEGLIWVGLTNGTFATQTSYLFLFFVFIIWPFWIPFSLFNIATKQSEKRLLIFPFTAAAIIVIATLSCFINYPISIHLVNHHITYMSALPYRVWVLGTICYLIATISPFFIVSRPHLWLMGTTLAIAYIISFIFYYQAILSVWCFFAAILSIFTLLFVR